MTPVQVHFLKIIRRNLRQWKRTLALWKGGSMRFYANNVDVTDEQIRMLQRIIAQNAAVLTEHDPENLTAENELELGEVEASDVWKLTPNRPVTFTQDADGHLLELHFFDTDEQAEQDAQAHPDRTVGWIGQDGWSISFWKT